MEIAVALIARCWNYLSYSAGQSSHSVAYPTRDVWFWRFKNQMMVKARKQ